MRKADLTDGVEYAWRDRHEFGMDGPRRVTLRKKLDGVRVLVTDVDGDFETTTTRLECPWSELGPDAQDRRFRMRADEYAHEEREVQERDPAGYEINRLFAHSGFDPGKGGTPRVPEWLPRLFDDLTRGVLKLELGQGRGDREQIACYQMIENLSGACTEIREAARDSWLVETLSRRNGPASARPGVQSSPRVSKKDSSRSPSSEIMPVRDGRMARNRSLTEYQTGSAAIGEFMLRVADDYDEVDRYGALAVQWAESLYLRHRDAAQPPRPTPPQGRRRNR